MSEDFDTAQAAIEAVNALDEAERWRALADELAASLHDMVLWLPPGKPHTRSIIRAEELLARYREAAKGEK